MEGLEIGFLPFKKNTFYIQSKDCIGIQAKSLWLKSLRYYQILPFLSLAEIISRDNQHDCPTRIHISPFFIIRCGHSYVITKGRYVELSKLETNGMACSSILSTTLNLKHKIASAPAFSFLPFLLFTFLFQSSPSSFLFSSSFTLSSFSPTNDSSTSTCQALYRVSVIQL